MISIVNVSKRYGKTQALDGVNLELPAGKIIGLCGPNGSGKTTLMKILVGLLRDFDGDVFINQHAINQESKALISYLPDINYIDGKVNGNYMRTYFNDMYSDFDSDKFDQMMKLMKLDINQPFNTMSKGMKEKLQVALVMSRKASIYILDEPIGGVDPASRELILNTILDNYDPQALVLISTHLIGDIEQIFDQVIFLKEGHVNLYDDVEKLRNEHGMSIDQLFREVFR
ncbi:MAG: ABC transporter ATP-binding protein [Erysipelothrix sp.]|nr:ABC transporter ATP-binding protein [Erysipelothrix sp.]